MNLSSEAIQSLKEYPHYIHDQTLSVFFDEKSELISKVCQLTSNFSVQDVDLKDAYLYYINSKEPKHENTITLDPLSATHLS